MSNFSNSLIPVSVDLINISIDNFIKKLDQQEKENFENLIKLGMGLKIGYFWNKKSKFINDAECQHYILYKKINYEKDIYSERTTDTCSFNRQVFYKQWKSDKSFPLKLKAACQLAHATKGEEKIVYLSLEDAEIVNWNL